MTGSLIFLLMASFIFLAFIFGLIESSGKDGERACDRVEMAGSMPEQVAATRLRSGGECPTPYQPIYMVVMEASYDAQPV